MGHVRNFAVFAAAPLIFLTLFVLVFGLYAIFDLPDREEIVSGLRAAYAEHGYTVIFFAALVEGLLFVNWYFPGSFVIAFGVVFARDAGLSPALVVLLVIFGFLITSVANYLLGKHGWYRLLLRFGLSEPLERMREHAAKRGLPIIFSTYFHPNVGALTATCAGILRFPFGPFFAYSFFALALWNGVLGVAVHLVGDAILPFVHTGFVGLILAAWLVIAAYRYARAHRLIPTFASVTAPSDERSE